MLLSENFISVKKDSNVSWDELKPMIISHLNDYYQKTDAPIISVKGDVKDAEDETENDNETVAKIKEVLDTKIRPAVARDGGDIKFKSFSGGIVKVELQGELFWLPEFFNDIKAGSSKLTKTLR